VTESVKEVRARARRVTGALRRTYPDADCALHHSSPLELLVATILSAQCTDERVNQVTPRLFRKYSDAAAYGSAEPAELEELIRSTGFFRNKARSLIGLGQALAERHQGQVPDRMEELVELPGVGRKTANVILGTWFERPAIFVDTHVGRLSRRLGWTGQKDPIKVELELQKVLPEKDWTFTSHALIWHGRRVCKARKPDCVGCVLSADCPSSAA
jgi:endonuclease-3